MERTPKEEARLLRWAVSEGEKFHAQREAFERHQWLHKPLEIILVPPGPWWRLPLPPAPLAYTSAMNDLPTAGDMIHVVDVELVRWRYVTTSGAVYEWWAPQNRSMMANIAYWGVPMPYSAPERL